MLGLIKGFIYMVFAILIAQGINYIYNFLIFYLKKKKNNIQNNTFEVSLNMLQCEKCKIYISKSEAYIVNGKVFCKKDHSE